MTIQRFMAWGVVAFSLIVLAEVPSTSQLAVAFAYLILVSVLLTVGPSAFANIQAMFGDSNGSVTQPGGKVIN
jgi:hypothetical protein